MITSTDIVQRINRRVYNWHTKSIRIFKTLSFLCTKLDNLWYNGNTNGIPTAYMKGNETMDATAQRPEFAEDEHLEYLDQLRESGVTNMFGAGQYLEEEFGFTRPEAREVLTYWMQTFGERHPRS